MLPAKWWTGHFASMAICSNSVSFDPMRTIVSTGTYVFELRLAERRSIGRNEDQLSLARTESLESALGAHGDLARFHHQGKARGQTAR